jgi:5'-nucleotidase / UDP-sugar diphosphatase
MLRNNTLLVALILGLFGCSDSGENPPVVDSGTVDSAPSEDGSSPQSPVKAELIILHTNDLHSHLMGHSPNADYSPLTTGNDETVGGYARLSAKIQQIRSDAGDTPVLLVDAGDFLMGSIFTLLSTSHSAELTEMKALGYDAIALGNHEFDWGPQGLAGFVNTAVAGGFDVPLLAANMKTDDTSDKDDMVEKLVTDGAIKKKTVKTLSNGIKVGLYGLMGKGAASVAPFAAPITFDPIDSTSTEMVKELRETDNVDVVIALSHSGIDSEGVGEDASLAQKVAGIDVVISGHTHDTLPQPAVFNSTAVVQTGSYGRNLGKMVLNLHEDGTTSVKSYELVSIDDSIEGDAATQTRIDGYTAAIDKLLETSGVGYSTVVAESDYDLTLVSFKESTLGNIITDSYLAAVSELQPSAKPDIAIETPGVIRDDLYRSASDEIWYADTYRVLPLGLGLDAKPGYPLLTVHLSYYDVRIMSEVIALAPDVGNNDYFLQIAGFNLEYDTSKSIFQRVSKMTLADGTEMDPADKTKCVKLVTNYYVYSLIGLLATLGAPAVIPKKDDCSTPIVDISKHFVDADPQTDGIQELKPHSAFVSFLSKFADTDGDKIPNLPAAYSKVDAANPRITAN